MSSGGYKCAEAAKSSSAAAVTFLPPSGRLARFGEKVLPLPRWTLNQAKKSCKREDGIFGQFRK